MEEMKNPTITISNLGPINKAKIEIKPLNIFIGEHNTGKSYAAQMVYYIARALRGGYIRIAKVEEGLGVRSQSEMRVIRKELKDFERLVRAREEFKFGNIGESLQNVAVRWWEKWESLCKNEMISSLNQYFMAEDIGELVRFNGGSVKCTITFCAGGKSGASVSLRIGKRPGKVNVDMKTPGILTIRAVNISRALPPFEMDYDGFQYALDGVWNRVWKGITDYDYYYLPAARSGILQLWNVLQIYVLDIVAEKMGLPGFVKDFFANMAKSGRSWGYARRQKSMMEALKILEGGILHGEIAYKRETPGPATIDYRFGDRASINIQRASSMVAELAPLDLWMMRLLRKGDLLIIEEPEAHLHPSSQIQIARLIARLVNSGIRIICTTHSPLLVNRVSNLMLASKVRESLRKDLGLEKVDTIKEEDLAVYQFIATDDGSKVKRLRMVRKFGIPEDEFLREYEKISLESYKVSS